MARPIIIAHRGASGYLPEHTLESAAFAHALGVDFVEQDVVLSHDDVLVVCHDIHLDTTTDVAARFPRRRRADGRYYVIDFTWEELRSLQVRERFDHRTGAPVFPQRFPHNGGSFRLCTMEEQLRLVQGLNRSTGRQVGVYPEIKSPAWHAAAGRDPGRQLLALLQAYGYVSREDPVFVQCFDADELRRLRNELRSPLRQIQLLEPEAVAQHSPATLCWEIATHADGVGPHLSTVVTADPTRNLQWTPLAQAARAAGLLMHPYTLRADTSSSPDEFETLLQFLLRPGGVDGVFIDQPDAALRVLQSVG